MKHSKNPPANKFDTDTVSRFYESRPDSVGDAGRFRQFSLTSTTNPHKVLPTRRDLPHSVPGRAEFADDCIVWKGEHSPPRIELCRSTPQWVADLLNRSTRNGIFSDSWRQQFVVESIQMISAKAPPSVASPSESKDDLKDWETSTGRGIYKDWAKSVLTGWKTREMVEMAQLFERYEVYAQVYQGLLEAGYDGRLYDLPRLRAMHRRRETQAAS